MGLGLKKIKCIKSAKIIKLGLQVCIIYRRNYYFFMKFWLKCLLFLSY